MESSAFHDLISKAEVYMLRRLLLSFSLLLIIIPAQAQRELGSYWFEDIAEIPRLSPYDMLDLTGFMVFPRFDPVVQVGGGDVVYLWRPDFAGLTRRHLTRFNLFMEQVWDIEFRIEQNENIFHHYTIGDTIVVLTVHDQFREKRQDVFAHYFEPDSGKLIRKVAIAEFLGSTESPVFFTTSKSKETLLFFQLRREAGTRRVSYYTDYLNSRGEVGFQGMKMTEVVYSSFTPTLQQLYTGTLSLKLDKKSKLIDLSPDDFNNLYLSWFDKPNELSIEYIQLANQERQTLGTSDFPRPEMLRYMYDTGFPPYIFEAGQVYLPMAERIEKGRDRGIKSFEMIHFDFETSEIETTHKVDVASGLLVAIEKSREEINARRLRLFDQYIIRDVVKLENDKTWMVTQFFSHDNFRGISSTSPGVHQTYEQYVGELVIYVFDSLNQPEQAIIVPSSQSIRGIRDRMTQFADLHFDEDAGELKILFREDSGDNYRGPGRLYFRSVDLETGIVSPRKLVYETRRRAHHTPFAFIEWINGDILQILSYEGDDERLYGVTINLALPPLSEEETKELRSQR